MCSVAQKVLVPLDGSPLSATVLAWVRSFAALVPTDLYLLQVVAPPVSYSTDAFGAVQVPGPADVQRWQDEARQALEAVDPGPARSVSRLVRVGSPAEEIVQAAAELGADLIAMSTHGRTGLARLALGSVTEQVVRRAARPVVVLRPSEAGLAAESGSGPR